MAHHKNNAERRAMAHALSRYKGRLRRKDGAYLHFTGLGFTGVKAYSWFGTLSQAEKLIAEVYLDSNQTLTWEQDE